MGGGRCGGAGLGNKWQQFGRLWQDWVEVAEQYGTLLIRQRELPSSALRMLQRYVSRSASSNT